LKKINTALDEVFIVVAQKFDDDRGYFFEGYNAKRFAKIGIDFAFVQDNFSRSKRGTVRGLHFQEPHAQGKLIRAIRGAVFDVVVDIRKGSPSFGKWIGVELSAENRHQIWVPPGFAHGFQALHDDTDIVYKVTDFWQSDCEHTVRWSDPDIGIAWPIADVTCSKKDNEAPTLSQSTHLPVFQGVS